MMERKDLKKFYEIIDELFNNSVEVAIKQIYERFPETNQNTISWRIYNLCKQGKLYKSGHGLYSLSKMDTHLAVGYEYMQKKAQEIYDIVMEYGYEFYVSGLDALVGEVLHVPEQYPVILEIEEDGINEISEVLNAKEFLAVKASEKELLSNLTLKSKVDVILIPSKNFTLSYENIAIKEKAFVDLYYAVTRVNYGISIQELSRIYENLNRNKMISIAKIREAAKVVGVVDEIGWLLDVKKMLPKVKEFMMHQLQEDK
ncbi:MAG: DUF6577 family protein [Anaerocolumna sp.]